MRSFLFIHELQGHKELFIHFYVSLWFKAHLLWILHDDNSYSYRHYNSVWSESVANWYEETSVALFLQYVIHINLVITYIVGGWILNKIFQLEKHK